MSTPLSKFQNLTFQENLPLIGADFCEVIHQDDYYRDITEIDKNPFTNCTEWDDVQAINWAKINHDVENWLKNTTSQRLLILDGTMLMADPFLLKLSDLQFMFHVDYSVAKIRRELRDNSGDPNWVEPEPENAFDLNIWPKYVEHRGKFWEYIQKFGLEGKAFLVDGTMSKELICCSLLEQIVE